jgi:hypothetical protein
MSELAHWVFLSGGKRRREEGFGCRIDSGRYNALMSTETWKPVTGYEALYEVSDLGRLYRLAGTRGPKSVGRIIAPHKKATGYCDYWLYANGTAKRVAAHRLIWASFNGPIPEGLQINHRNGKKNDNRLANMELLTPSENTAHGFRVLGRKSPNNPSPGVRNGSAKLTEEKVREIRRLYANGLFQHEIAKMFGVSQRMISLITRLEKWAHLE